MTTSPTEQSTEQDPELAIKHMSLWEKIFHVQQEIGYVPKSGKNTHFSFEYATEVDFLKEIKPLLGKYRLTIIATELEHKREGKTTFVKMEFDIRDIDSAESTQLVYTGQGDDPGDKGGYKAMTGAMKYFLYKTFLVATGDDPEEEEKKPVSKAVPPKKPVKEVSPELRKMNDLAKKLGMTTQQEIETFTDLKLVSTNLPEIVGRLEAEIEARKN